MQSPGIALSFHREMANSSRELVGPDVSAAVTFESYPRFIKNGFQDYQGLGIKGSTAYSKHVPSVRSRLLGNNLFWSLPHKEVEFLKLPAFGRSFQIEATGHRGDLRELLDQRSNQGRDRGRERQINRFLLPTTSVCAVIIAGSDEQIEQAGPMQYRRDCYICCVPQRPKERLLLSRPRKSSLRPN
jgi:hypothetical protein